MGYLKFLNNSRKDEHNYKARDLSSHGWVIYKNRKLSYESQNIKIMLYVLTKFWTANPAIKVMNAQQQIEVLE